MDPEGKVKVKEGDVLDIKVFGNKVGTARIARYTKRLEKNEFLRGASLFVFVDVPNEPTQCGPHIFRWRQHLTVKNQAGDFLKWKGKEKIANNMLDPEPANDDKDWYYTNSQWNRFKSTDGRTALFNDSPHSPLSALNEVTTEVIFSLKLELVMVRDLSFKSGGTRVLTIDWGFRYTAATHSLIEGP